MMEDGLFVMDGLATPPVDRGLIVCHAMDLDAVAADSNLLNMLASWVPDPEREVNSRYVGFVSSAHPLHSLTLRYQI
jgi:hypothetical protein